jgi:hypothetical protein
MGGHPQKKAKRREQNKAGGGFGFCWFCDAGHTLCLTPPGGISNNKVNLRGISWRAISNKVHMMAGPDNLLSGRAQRAGSCVDSFQPEVDQEAKSLPVAFGRGLNKKHRGN